MSLDLVPAETAAETPTEPLDAETSGPWLKVNLGPPGGDLPIWVDGGAVTRTIARHAGTLVSQLTSGAMGGPSGMALRLGLPAVVRTFLDVVRWAVDNGHLDLPRPEPPRKGDVLAYFISWASGAIVDGLASVEWQADYADTTDGGCQITRLAPRADLDGTEAARSADAPDAGADPAE